jgi:uncharacterized protein (DUF1810 family)
MARQDTNDPYNLEHFIDAQNSVYERVRAELSAGQKQGHWIWFIFPQLRGLGMSAMSQEFGISSLDEAKAYINHPILGARLRECTQLVLNVQNRSVDEIFGYPDNLKFKSSMTLFAKSISDNLIFKNTLEKYFGGEGDPSTLERLGS